MAGKQTLEVLFIVMMLNRIEPSREGGFVPITAEKLSEYMPEKFRCSPQEVEDHIKVMQEVLPIKNTDRGYVMDSKRFMVDGFTRLEISYILRAIKQTPDTNVKRINKESIINRLCDLFDIVEKKYVDCEDLLTIDDAEYKANGGTIVFS